jgi:hypothetical protein
MSEHQNHLAVQLRPYIWIIIVFTAVYAISNASYSSPELLIASIAVWIAAVLPIVMWTTWELPGLPLFPAYAFTFVPWDAFPLIMGHIQVMKYLPDQQLQSGLTAAGYLLLATAAWYTMLKAVKPPQYVRAFSGSSVWYLFTLILIIVTGFNCSMRAGWVPELGNWYSLINNGANAAANVSLFVLWFAIGRKNLSYSHQLFVTVLTMAFLTCLTAGLILGSTFAAVFICAISFTIARSKVPYVSLLIVTGIIAVLHPGKFDMREYHAKDKVTPLGYPAFYSMWVDYSLARVKSGELGEKKRATSSVVERTSIIHMMMLVQSKTPSTVPHFWGGSYEPLPELMIPRILYSDKPLAHVSTNMLSVRYGLQTRESALKATIGFSLESEAYANFGYPGVGVLAVLLGGFWGWITSRASLGKSLTLTQCAALMSVSLLSTCSASAGVLVSTLSQSLLVLFIVGLLFTRVEVADWNLPTLPDATK